MKTIKVLHVVNISFVLPYYIGEQFDFFSERGVEFYVACKPSAHFFQYAERKKFFPLVVDIERNFDLIGDLKSIYKLARFIKSEKIDIVIGHTPKGGLIGMAAAFLCGTEKRIYFRHGIMYETSRGVKRVVLKSIERLTGHLAKKVVCVSESVMEISSQERLGPDSRSIILNKGTCNGIDALHKFNKEKLSQKFVDQLRISLGIKSNERVIGFVGRLVNDKGINELVSAWKLLNKSVSNIILLLVGPFEERDSINPDLQDYILQTPNIIHTGLINDITPYYCLMDIFILPSYREGFPTVVLEASAMELPIITTRSTGCCDSIIDNETGLFVDLDSVDISEKLKQYLDDADLARTHGLNGRSFVLANFYQKTIWDEIGNKVFEMT